MWIRILIACLFLVGGDVFAFTVQSRPSPGVAGSAPASGTNYVNDANCMAAYYFNADGSDIEIDRKDGDDDLTVSQSDTIPRSNAVGSGWSGYSRDFEASEADFLTKTDNSGDLSIYGLNQHLSVVARVRMESCALGKVLPIVSKYSYDNNLRSWKLSLASTGVNTAVVNIYMSCDGTTGTTVSCSGLTTLNSDTDYSISFVYNDTDVRVYVDGVLDNTCAYSSGMYNTSAYFRIGATMNNDQFFDGLIDDVAVFNRALSADEVMEIATYGITGNKGGSD